MEVKTYSSILQENEKPIYALAKRVNFMSETLEKVVITQNEMMNEQSRISAKIDKICDRIFQNPDYFSVGEIALKQGISQKTVRRHIKKGNIPYERNKGEKSYRIPSAEYYQSLSHDGASSWFQNHTRE
jgi:excisionase family DNA binding protein